MYTNHIYSRVTCLFWSFLFSFRTHQFFYFLFNLTSCILCYIFDFFYQHIPYGNIFFGYNDGGIGIGILIWEMDRMQKGRENSLKYIRKLNRQWNVYFSKIKPLNWLDVFSIHFRCCIYFNSPYSQICLLCFLKTISTNKWFAYHIYVNKFRRIFLFLLYELRRFLHGIHFTYYAKLLWWGSLNYYFACTRKNLCWLLFGAIKMHSKFCKEDWKWGHKIVKKHLDACPPSAIL